MNNFEKLHESMLIKQQLKVDNPFLNNEEIINLFLKAVYPPNYTNVEKMNEAENNDEQILDILLNVFQHLDYNIYGEDLLIEYIIILTDLSSDNNTYNEEIRFYHILLHNLYKVFEIIVGQMGSTVKFLILKNIIKTRKIKNKFQ